MSVKHSIICDCPACGDPMDITAIAPFTRVSCAHCGENTRVKRDFGPYHLEKRLSIGGMSVVFIARDTLLDREVAVKILNEDYSADERRITAFEHEARVTASLSHPNIVRVLTTGRAYDRFFIAMELVPGGHFEQHIRADGKIPEARMVRLAIQIANGLKAAHAANLIHRDIKPGNILLDADGNAKIVDFGLALVTQGGTARADEFWATPYYVPPETIDGKAEDFRSDIYAFGATLYHALAGKPPCNEKSMATEMLRTAKQNIIPLHRAEPELSLAVCDIVQKSMAYHPDDRYSSYDALIRDLEEAANQTAHGVTRISAGQAASRRAQARRNKRLAISSATMFAAVIVICAIAWVMNRGVDSPPPPDAETAAETANPAEPPRASSPDVAQLLREANDAMVARLFNDAASQFRFLLIHPPTQEPTRTWSGVQATLAALLDGDARFARDLARDTTARAANSDIDDAGLEATVLPVLRELARRDPTSELADPDGPMDAPTLLAWMLAGLHNWQYAKPADAARFFETIATSPLDESAQWAAHFQQFARDCLHDIRLLNDAVFSRQPSDLTEAELALDHIATLQHSLATHGRAAQIIHQRRREILELRDAFELAMELEGDPGDLSPDADPLADPPAESVPGPDPDLSIPTEDPDPVARIQEHLANYEFQQARQIMRTLDDAQVPASGRSTWMTLTRSAQTFLDDLQSDLRSGDALPISEVLLKSGETEHPIGPHESRSLLVDGGGKVIPWQTIHADSYIDWHRARVRRIEDPTERLRAHEAAIAFDLLSGDRWRAGTAIERLGEDNPNFQNYWNIITENLPR